MVIPPPNITAESSNGDIIIDTVNGEVMSYKTSNGDVKINDVKYSNATYHETKIPYIEATTSNGNVRINFLP